MGFDDVIQEVSQWQLLVVLFSGLIITGFPDLTGPGSPVDALLVVLMFIGPALTLIIIFIEYRIEMDEANAEDFGLGTCGAQDCGIAPQL